MVNAILDTKKHIIPKKELCAMYIMYVMAVWTGLEPATSCVTGRHSNQLNYQTNNMLYTIDQLKTIASWIFMYNLDYNISCNKVRCKLWLHFQYPDCNKVRCKLWLHFSVPRLQHKPLQILVALPVPRLQQSTLQILVAGARFELATFGL